MYNFPIGIIADSFRKPMPEALAMAAKLGAKGVQVYATRGEMSPEELKGQKRRDFLKMVKDNGLVISALCGDLGRGFGNPELNPGLIERSKLILEMAKELETDIVTTHIGVTPVDPNHPRYKIMQDACGQLAEYADSLKAHFAIETGPETSLVLKNFLDGLHSTGVAVNLDPANLCMVTRDNPVDAVYNLQKYIVHTHAKDGNCLHLVNPEYIYRVVHPVPEGFGGIKCFEEVPLGTGSVDFHAYLTALEDIGYKGFLTIEREVGGTPEEDIQIAFDYLKKVMA